MSKNIYVKNPWHSASPGPNAPKIVNAIIEIPAESKAKYELEKETGLLKLDRVLYSAVHYPANYGFIPQSYCDDNDPLDILVFCTVSVQPMCMMEAKVLGVMHMLDQGEADDKIIAVAKGDNALSHFNDISELPQHLLDQIQRFFEDYKKLEKKEVKVGHYENSEVAQKTVQESLELYKKKFHNKQE